MRRIGLLFLLLCSLPGMGDEFGGSSKPLLPVDEAFRFGAHPEGSGVRIFWQVTPGYFLYRDKISVRTNGELIALDLPEGEWRQDELFGRVQVLDGLVSVDLSSQHADGPMDVVYQGCAAAGYCYPPQKKSLNSGKVQIISEKPASFDL